VLDHLRIHHIHHLPLLPQEEVIEGGSESVLGTAVTHLRGEVGVVGLDAALAALGDGGAVGTDFVAESADHALDLAVEVVNVGALHLLEVLQLLGVAELELAFPPFEGFLGDRACFVGRRKDGIFLPSPLVVEVGNLLPS
jgi:hypothetical protein